MERAGHQLGAIAPVTSTLPATSWAFDDGQLLGQAFSIIHCADVNGAPLTYAHTAAPVLGPLAVTPGVAATTGPSVDVSSTARVAAPSRRVESLRGLREQGRFHFSSSPVHRALVLVLGTNIAVLLDCSKSSRQCSLPSFLTYLRVSK